MRAARIGVLAGAASAENFAVASWRAGAIDYDKGLLVLDPPVK